ncbi:MAG: carbohydrate kinase [Chitinivibrionales bacterium]|nr:carbohydrate kinase [Chitinivibrionales bacterium]
MSSKTFLAFGEILWDILPDHTALGGAPFNLAYRASTLGLHAMFASRLGDDDLGREAFARVEQLGMDTRWIQWDRDHPTGTVDVSLTDDGTPSYVINPGVAYDFIEPDAALLTEAGNADCVCYGSLVQRGEVSRITLRELLERAAGALKLCDINLRTDCFTPRTVAWSLERADVLKINEDEVSALAAMFGLASSDPAGFCVEASRRWGLSHCVVTLGAAGSLAYAPDVGHVYEPGFRVTVADSLGAGDSFTAAFVHGLLRGESLAECCRRGNAMGALVASECGGTPAVDAVRVDALLSPGADRVWDDRFSSLGREDSSAP